MATADHCCRGLAAAAAALLAARESCTAGNSRAGAVCGHRPAMCDAANACGSCATAALQTFVACICGAFAIAGVTSLLLMDLHICRVRCAAQHAWGFSSRCHMCMRQAAGTRQSAACVTNYKRSQAM